MTTRASTTQSAPKSPPKCGYTIACRDAHLPTIGEKDIFSAMDKVGVEGLEVLVDSPGDCTHMFDPHKKYSIANKEQIQELGEAMQKHNKRITAFCLANRFDERVDEEVAFVVKTTRAAVGLGVPAIRLDFVPRRLKKDEFLDFAIVVGRRIIKDTGDTKIRFGVENHGGTTNDPEFLRNLFKGVGSKRFGLTLDTGNFYWFGHPLSKLYDIYNEFAPWACHTHCKSINYPQDQREKQRKMGWEYAKYCCPVDQGDIDFGRVVDILKKNNYQGDLCIENESLRRVPEEEQRGEILTKEADFLRRLVRAR